MFRFFAALLAASVFASATVSPASAECSFISYSASCTPAGDCDGNMHLLWAVDSSGCSLLTVRVERKCGTGPYNLVSTNATSPFDNCVENNPCLSGGWTYRLTATCQCGGEQGQDVVEVGPTVCP
jgi:hypothetical protein